jgi:hypothetical protein
MKTALSFLLFSTLNLVLVRSVWSQTTEPNATDDWFYTTDGVDFTGPGTVTCPFEDYLLAACFADFFVEVNQCDNVQACAQTIELPGNASFINIAIPCDCGMCADLHLYTRSTRHGQSDGHRLGGSGLRLVSD